MEFIKDGQDWRDLIWEVMQPATVPLTQVVEEEAERDAEFVDAVADIDSPIVSNSPASTSRKGKSKVYDVGVEERKRKVLCRRSEVAMNEDMKSFIKNMFEASFTSFKKEFQHEFQQKFVTPFGDRISKMEAEIRGLKDVATPVAVPRTSGEPSTIFEPDNTSPKKQSQPEKKKVKKKKQL